ncbi:MAG: serine/threonine-protein kinase [Myxococcota bacterium]
MEDVDLEQSTIEVDIHPMRMVPNQPREITAVQEARRAKVLGALFAQPTVRRFGRYIVLDELGEGAMGVVLKAYDDVLDRQVAIKVLHTDPVGNHGPRLKREAQAMAKLSHPNVVQVFEVGEVDEKIFLVMELVKGQTLRQWQNDSGTCPDWTECLELYLQAGRGLAAAHTKGLVHRDFKPGNVVVDNDGRVRVLDFGLARRDGADADESVPSVVVRVRSAAQRSVPLDVSLTQTGAILGTPAYMPPEQMAGHDASVLSDQFSFCVSLYEAVYGERPFPGGSIPELMEAMTSDTIKPPPPESLVPRELRRVLLRGLSSEPHRRWPSMEVLLRKLRRLLGSMADQEIVDLRRHVDLRVGVRSRVVASFIVGLINLGAAIYAQEYVLPADLDVAYPFLLTLCVVSSSCVLGYIITAIHRRARSQRRRPMSLVSRTQNGMMLALSTAMVAFPSLGWYLQLPLRATVSLALLTFALFLGAMAVLLPRMLIPAVTFVVSAALTVVFPDWLWLWWATAGGLGIWLMGSAWHGLSRRPRVS